MQTKFQGLSRHYFNLSSMFPHAKLYRWVCLFQSMYVRPKNT